MSILHVIPGLTHERGGPSAVLEALVRHQVDLGHRVVVLATDQGRRHGEQPTELDSRAVAAFAPAVIKGQESGEPVLSTEY